MEPLLDSIPVDLKKWTVKGGIADKWKNRKPIGALLRSGMIYSAQGYAVMLKLYGRLLSGYKKYEKLFCKNYL